MDKHEINRGTVGKGDLLVYSVRLGVVKGAHLIDSSFSDSFVNDE
jgi:hypothetical protein